MTPCDHRVNYTNFAHLTGAMNMALTFWHKIICLWGTWKFTNTAFFCHTNIDILPKSRHATPTRSWSRRPRHIELSVRSCQRYLSFQYFSMRGKMHNGFARFCVTSLAEGMLKDFLGRYGGRNCFSTSFFLRWIRRYRSWISVEDERCKMWVLTVVTMSTVGFLTVERHS